MKKLSIVFLAAVSLATFGCKKKGGGDVVAKMTEFKERMCACKDKACADKVNEDLMKWSQEQAKGGDKEAKGTDDENKRIVAISEDMSKCQQKLNDTGAAPGGAPPAGGSADTAAPPAAPAAGSGDTAAPPAAPPAGGAADGSAAGSAK
jgi:hypothetical protein